MQKLRIAFMAIVISCCAIISVSFPANANDDIGELFTSEVVLDKEWKYAECSKINDGIAILYEPTHNRKNITIAVNAGHGTVGGEKIKTQCHPDGSPKTTGGSTSKGAVEASAVSSGMTFNDGTREAEITLAIAKMVKERLLSRGYSVLMLRDSADVQLDNIARTVISNNVADYMVSFHWDGDGLDYDKGVFYIKVPEQLKGMQPVSEYWQKHDAFGEAIISKLEKDGFKKYKGGSMSIDLTQMSYSEIPSVDIELGNQCSKHDEYVLSKMAESIASAIDEHSILSDN